MSDTGWLAVIIGVGSAIMLFNALCKEAKIMKLRRKTQKQREIKKRLQAKWSKRLYQEGRKK